MDTKAYLWIQYLKASIYLWIPFIFMDTKSSSNYILRVTRYRNIEAATNKPAYELIGSTTQSPLSCGFMCFKSSLLNSGGKACLFTCSRRGNNTCIPPTQLITS